MATCRNDILVNPKLGQIAAAKTGQIQPKRRKNFGAWMGKKMTKTHRWLKSAVTTAAANPTPSLPNPNIPYLQQGYASEMAWRKKQGASAEEVLAVAARRRKAQS